MEMSIDESISILNYQKDWYELNKSKAIDVAIDTMHKYQKIEQIIKDHDNDIIPEDFWYIDRVREVIKDDSN